MLCDHDFWNVCKYFAIGAHFCECNSEWNPSFYHFSFMWFSFFHSYRLIIVFLFLPTKTFLSASNHWTPRCSALCTITYKLVIVISDYAVSRLSLCYTSSSNRLTLLIAESISPAVSPFTLFLPQSAPGLNLWFKWRVLFTGIRSSCRDWSKRMAMINRFYFRDRQINLFFSFCRHWRQSCPHKGTSTVFTFTSR